METDLRKSSFMVMLSSASAGWQPFEINGQREATYEPGMIAGQY